MSKKAPQWKANHLLNFHYGDVALAPRNPPRRTRVESWDRHGRLESGFGRTHRSVQAEQAAFVLGRYHFGLSEVKVNALCLKDPDRMVDWDTIVEVTCNGPVDEHICPICLHYPIACRIAKCGHMFCLPCILVYLEGQPCRPCCMCPRPLQLKQLKQLRLTPSVKRSIGNVVNFTMVHRDKGSVCLFAGNESLQPIPEYGSTSAMFSHFNYCSPEVAESLKMAEAQEIRDRFEMLSSVDTMEADQEREMLINALSVVESNMTSRGAAQSSGETLGLQAPAEECPEEFYMFMASDGQPIFLCSLNMHMLLYDLAPEADQPQTNAFAALHQLSKNGHSVPTAIEGKLLQLDSYTQSDDTRRRFKHLAHLPLRTEFYIAEVEMSAVVKDSTMLHFKNQLHARSNARQRLLLQAKQEEEEAMRRHKELVEARRAGAALPMPSEFPALEADDDEDLSLVPDLSSVMVETEVVTQEHLEEEPVPGSFAAIQREQARASTAGAWGGDSRGSFIGKVKTVQAPPPSSSWRAQMQPRGHQVVAAATVTASKKAEAKEEDPHGAAVHSLFDRLLEAQASGKGSGKRGRKKNTISLTALHMQSF